MSRPPNDDDLVTCIGCDRGTVLAHPDEPNPADRFDSCPICNGTGYVPFAAWLGGAA